MRGRIGKDIVIKQYGKKTVISKYPDMSKVKRTKLQKVYQKRFAEAVAYAQAINRNPKKKAAYAKKAGKGKSVYHFALKEYFKKNKLR
jgi:hypothetical protein